MREGQGRDILSIGDRGAALLLRQPQAPCPCRAIDRVYRVAADGHVARDGYEEDDLMFVFVTCETTVVQACVDGASCATLASAHQRGHAPRPPSSTSTFRIHPARPLLTAAGFFCLHSAEHNTSTTRVQQRTRERNAQRISCKVHKHCDLATLASINPTHLQLNLTKPSTTSPTVFPFPRLKPPTLTTQRQGVRQR